MKAEVGRRRGGEARARPGLDLHYVHPVGIPHAFPEAVAYLTGVRLFATGADEVTELIRAGASLRDHLTPDELGVELELGRRSWERWFRLGWSRASEREEDA